MINLNNGCSCSEPSVYPKNWESGGPTLLKKKWLIQYYFRDPVFLADPVFKKKYPYGFPARVKGMNDFKTLSERREATRRLLENELHLLTKCSYNPITKQHTAPELDTPEYEIDPETPWLMALEAVHKRLQVRCKSDIKSTIKYVGIAARQLRYDLLAIKDVRRKHIKIILEHIQKTKPRPAKDGKKAITWGPASYNRYRSHLMSCFKELIELEATEMDPVSTLKKQDEAPEKKEVLTIEEQVMIYNHLKEKVYDFWRYMMIFFHSGARTTELLLLQKKNVDLENQTFTITIIKGQKKRRSTRTIMDVALPLWEELLATASPDDFIFSTGLLPGAKAIRPDQIKRRWRLHVKKNLGINKDFYSLKHLHSDQIAEVLGLEAAAMHDGHTSTAMVRKVYAVNQEKREREKLKKLSIKFG